MLNGDKQDQAIYKMVKCITENKMSSAIKELKTVVNESLKKRIITAIRKSK